VARLAVIFVSFCLAAASCGGNAVKTVNPPQVKSCTMQGRPARCGTLAVPEDRLTGQGRQIKIKFVVFPAVGRNRAPDPVVYFAGGPGGSAIDAIPEQMPSLISLNQHRDLVFIDQRGTGGSNSLNCPSPPETLADPSLVRRSIQSCLDSLRARADLRFYTSAMAAQDAAQVLTALHYGQVNLLGGSYGVTAAQVFQRPSARPCGNPAARCPGPRQTTTSRHCNRRSTGKVSCCIRHPFRSVASGFSRCGTGTASADVPGRRRHRNRRAPAAGIFLFRDGPRVKVDGGHRASSPSRKSGAGRGCVPVALRSSRAGCRCRRWPR